MSPPSASTTWLGDRTPRRRTPLVLVAGFLVAAASAPMLADAVTILPSSGSWLFTATQALLLLVLATNWATIASVLGRLDLGHAVFVGVGAYASGGILIGLGWSPIVAMATAGAAAAVIGAAVGAMFLRLTPHLFAIATFALLILVREAVRLLEPVTRGAQGLALPPAMEPTALYLLVLAVLAVALGLSWALRGDPSRWGSDLTAGFGHRLVVYTSVAASSGLAGALWASQRLFIDPNNAFQALRSFDMAFAAIIGGIGTIIGPLVGGALVFVSREAWPVVAASWHAATEVVVLIMVVLRRPSGLVRGRSGAGERLFGVASRLVPPSRSRTGFSPPQPPRIRLPAPDPSGGGRDSRVE